MGVCSKYTTIDFVKITQGQVVAYTPQIFFFFLFLAAKKKDVVIKQKE